MHSNSDNPGLSVLWGKAVELGQTVSEFDAPRDDPEGRWRSGDKILFGVSHSHRGLHYSAKNLSTGKVINATVEEKEISGTDFRCRLNGYRALRPGGNASALGRQQDIPPQPAECRFYCQNPANPLSLLRRPPLAQLRLKNYLWNAYYNAAPLEPEGHFMWVPVGMSGGRLTLPHYLQALDRAVIEDIFLLRERSTEFVLLYNSLHGGASVNHLHLHTVYRRRPLAIEKQRAPAGRRLHVLDAYPAAGFMFQGVRSADLACEYSLRLQEIGMPFNLILTDGRVFLVPRNIEHEVTAEFPSGPLGALDICGSVVTTDRATYDSMSKERIEAALGKSTIDAGKLLRSRKDE